jgi:hypothetical protein
LKHDTVTACRDATIAAVVVEQRPLFYTEGADATTDRPAHIRAGSGLAAVPGGIALIQDDANFIAVVGADGKGTRALTLPAGEAGLRQFDDVRGNKKYKLDLEACVAIETAGETLFLALGSGSKKRREQVAMVRGWEKDEPEVTLVHVPQLYDALRREHAFAGSELNVEGAIFVGDRVRLFGRGNGEVRGELRPINATCDLEWPVLLAHLESPESTPPPTPTNVIAYDLGSAGDTLYSFTDATVWRDTVLYCAAAEASPDATRDGPVTGSVLGTIDANRARWTSIVDTSGAPLEAKVEGLTAVSGVANRVYAVADADDPAAASRLLTIELRGAW